MLDAETITSVEYRDRFRVDDVSVTEETKQSIRIYPNPAKNVLYIHSDEAVTQVRITDMAGRKFNGLISF